MFYMKGDDMEEMFRKAADGYELNEEMAADWNKVQTALQDEEATVIPAKKEKKRRKYFFVWIFLVLGLISLFIYETAFHFSSKEQKGKSEISGNLNSKTKTDLKADQNTAAKESNSSAAVALNNASSNGTVNIKKPSRKNNFSVTSNHLFPGMNNKSNDDIESNLANSNNTLQDNNSFINTEKGMDEKDQPNNKNTPENYLSTNNPSNNTTTVELENKTNVSQKNNSKQKIRNKNYTRQSFAYASLTGNADISFVKFQKASALGYGLGIMGGYHFKNGISLETGLLYDKKNYYTKGEYFDTKNLPYLQYVNLLSANGNCNMWEIPVNIKYDFNSQKKHNFFVTAGLSSYLMNKEFYNFKYEKNGVAGEKGYDYYHSSQNWFSVLNLGGGINIKTSDRYFLQVQPYYKIPIAGVGKGNLSLSSAGINLSLTKRFK